MVEDDSNHFMDHSFQSFVRCFDLLLALLLDLKFLQRFVFEDAILRHLDPFFFLSSCLFL